MMATALNPLQPAKYQPETILTHQNTHKSHGSPVRRLEVDHFQAVTEAILDLFYPRQCETCQKKMTGRIKTRPYIIRCNLCGKQSSRLSCTPLHHLKLPQWMFGFAVEESFVRHPGVITSRELQRRLGIAYNSARMLKQRVQLFASQQKPAIVKLMREELRQRFPENKYRLPDPDSSMLPQKAAEKPIPQADTVVLFSASQRANQGRKRYKHGGATASIYLSEKLGGKQIGTLTQVFSWKKGPLMIDCIPDQKIERLKPLLDGYLTPDSPLFTDEGYKWLKGLYRNHRMVNHSAQAKDKRNRWARNRWCKNGVHSQVAEGNGGAMKRAFSAYGYVRPEYAPLYLNEWSFWKNIKYFGLESIARESREMSAPLSKEKEHGKDERHPQESKEKLGTQFPVRILPEAEQKKTIEKERTGSAGNRINGEQGKRNQAASNRKSGLNGKRGNTGSSGRIDKCATRERKANESARATGSARHTRAAESGTDTKNGRPPGNDCGVGTRVDSAQPILIWPAH
ncbi:MAG: transposase [Spirochaetales bacterium]|nr:transposase [Spirochaetales bacterium]